jgi:hypothetical protein
MRALPIFIKTLARGPRVRSFQIQPEPAGGWIASEEADRRVVRRFHLTDWHRVERTMARFVGQVTALHREGWVDLRLPRHET